MFQDNDIDKIKKRFGVENGKSITGRQFETIMDNVALGEISKEHAMLLLNALPNFVELQKTYLDGIKTIANSARETQKSAMDAISKVAELDSLISIINKLSDNVESEELKSKIIDALIKIANLKNEIVKILQEVNTSNNSIWKEIALTVAAVASVASVAVAAFIATTRGGNKNA